MDLNTAFSLGVILLAGLLSAKLIQKIKTPVITAYILLGVIIGPSILNLVSSSILDSSGLISTVVLSFVAFSLGQNFSLERFRRIGKSVLSISIAEALGAWALVTLAIWLLLKQPFYVALIFGAIAPATAPAAIVMVTRQYKARGTFTDTLLGIVAIDDAWGIILFAFSLAVAKSLADAHKFVVNSVLSGTFYAGLEIIGALILGSFLAWALSKLSRFIKSPQEHLIYTLGFILINTGLAIYLGLSVLLANMFLGAVLVNINKTSFKFFDALRSIDSPFYLLFFVLAGASLDIGLLRYLSSIGMVYIFMRVIGKIIGVHIGARIAKVENRIRKYIAFGLIPQAGIALGLALIAKATFKNIGDIILSTIVATTIIYEVLGPLCTKWTLSKAGEIY
jgi:Kef-type K+ transport system membrane component KefB